MSVKGILAAAVTASLASAGVAQPAFPARGAPGSIDTSFGHNGTVITDLGAAGTAPNGKFLAIGAGANPATGSTELIVTRYFQ